MKNIVKDKVFKSVLIVFVIGIIFGIIFSYIIKDSESETIYKGIEEYISLINKESVTTNDFINSFANYFFIVNLVFISSFAFIFSPIIYFINFYKGFSLGFLITVLIMNYKLKGIKYALLVIFPHEYIFILFLLLLSSFMLKNVLKLIKLYKEDKSIKIKSLYKKFSIIYLITIIVISLISLMEVFLNNKLLSILF